MYLINPILTDNKLNSDGYNELLGDIDRTIMCLAEVQYQNQSLGFRDYVDLDLYDRLCDYREILMDKFMGCDCLQSDYLVLIITKVKKLIC